MSPFLFLFFFFNDTATTEIYTLSLHDALPIYVFLFMLFLLIVTSGQLLVRSILEEKSNRIVEVLVSSCSSTELMAGEGLGLSALCFTQMGFWGLIGVIASLSFGVVLVTPGIAALLVVYFVLGYLFYAAGRA